MNTQDSPNKTQTHKHTHMTINVNYGTLKFYMAIHKHSRIQCICNSHTCTQIGTDFEKSYIDITIDGSGYRHGQHYLGYLSDRSLGEKKQKGQ